MRSVFVGAVEGARRAFEALIAAGERPAAADATASGGYASSERRRELLDGVESATPSRADVLAISAEVDVGMQRAAPSRPRRPLALDPAEAVAAQPLAEVQAESLAGPLRLAESAAPPAAQLALRIGRIAL